MKRFAIFALLLFALLLSAAFALSDEGMKAESGLNNATAAIGEMKTSGYNTTKASDILFEAKQIFDGQKALETSGAAASYNLVIAKTDEIVKMKSLAFAASLNLKAAEIRLADNKKQGVNATEAEKTLAQARSAFAGERYDEIDPLLEKFSKQIQDAQLQATVLRTMYEASRKTLVGFIEQNWQAILFLIIAGSLIFAVFYKNIRIFLIKNKIESLETEREILKRLIKKAQYEYYVKKIISEGAYHIKLKKFGEMIRDINRQIPVQIEEHRLLTQKLTAIEKAERAALAVLRKIAGVFKKIWSRVELPAVSMETSIEMIGIRGIEIKKIFEKILKPFALLAKAVADITIKILEALLKPLAAAAKPVGRATKEFVKKIPLPKVKIQKIKIPKFALPLIRKIKVVIKIVGRTGKIVGKAAKKIAPIFRKLGVFAGKIVRKINAVARKVAVVASKAQRIFVRLIARIKIPKEIVRAAEKIKKRISAGAEKVAAAAEKIKARAPEEPIEKIEPAEKISAPEPQIKPAAPIEEKPKLKEYVQSLSEKISKSFGEIKVPKIETKRISAKITGVLAKISKAVEEKIGKIKIEKIKAPVPQKKIKQPPKPVKAPPAPEPPAIPKIETKEIERAAKEFFEKFSRSAKELPIAMGRISNETARSAGKISGKILSRVKKIKIPRIPKIKMPELKLESKIAKIVLPFKKIKAKKIAGRFVEGSERVIKKVSGGIKSIRVPKFGIKKIKKKVRAKAEKFLAHLKKISTPPYQ